MTDEVDDSVLIPISDLPLDVFERLRTGFAKVPPLALSNALELIRYEVDRLQQQWGQATTRPDEAFERIMWFATLALVQDRAGTGPKRRTAEPASVANTDTLH